MRNGVNKFLESLENSSFFSKYKIEKKKKNYSETFLPDLSRNRLIGEDGLDGRRRRRKEGSKEEAFISKSRSDETGRSD